MLKGINIRRFKSVHDARVEFGRINLFIGGNGSGKSNLLEAIGVLAAALSRGISDDDLARKGVRLTPPALMKSAFKGGKIPATLRLEADFDSALSYAMELTATDASPSLSFFTENARHGTKRLFGRSGAGSTVFGQRLKREPEGGRGLWDQTRLSYEYDDGAARQFDALGRYAIYAPQTEFLRESRTGTVSDPPIGLHGEGLAQAVAGLLQQRRALKDKGISKGWDQVNDAFSLVKLPNWVQGVRVGPINSSLRSRGIAPTEGNIVYFLDSFMHEKRRTLSAYDSSEGTLFLLFIGVLLGHAQAPKIFALDNVDSALNPKLTRQLIERMVTMIKRKQEHGLATGPDQIFMTSHNPTALDAFDLFDPDQRVFVAARDGKGRTTVDRLKPRDGMTREEWRSATKGRNLSQMWIDGDIKGALGVSGDTL